MNNNGLKSQIKTILEHHRGRRQSITRRELRRILELDDMQDRKLRLIVAELRHEGLPILFATSKPAGYYLPESLAELNEGMDKMRSYIIDECIVLRDFKVFGSQYISREVQGKLV